MKKVLVFFFFDLLMMVSCKKDPSLSSTITNNKVAAPTAIATSYNITYHLWYPYHTIYAYLSHTNNSSGVPNSVVDSLIVPLDSTNTHNITLITESFFETYLGVAPGTPQYGTDASVFSPSSSVYLANCNKVTNLNISPSNFINDSLNWINSIDLMEGGYMNYGGVWFYTLNYGYIGIKIASPAGNKYGWIKLSVPDAQHITMEAQALNNNYGQYIKAGQTH